MDNEPEEMIKHQMLETRASLAEKLETLEQQVVGTVQNPTTAVTDTVETVKEAVQETVQMARASVQNTVEAVKDTFDLSLQVRRHPWIMMAGSVALGYAGGCLLNRAGSHRQTAAAPSLSTLADRSATERDGGTRLSRSEMAASPTTNAHHGWVGEIGEAFQSEIGKLKGLAVGTILSAVRDLVASSAPPQIGPQLAEIIDSATVKLGGQPISGPVFDTPARDFSARGRA
jgi:ElaB/YqjD/DUF883 family membrane-anchored ribosome-binding protein